MGSGRYLDDPLTFTRNPPSSSSPITESSFLAESISRSGSFESGSLRGGDGDCFSDVDFALDKLAGTVQFYERHVFLCYKKPSVWPARIEASEFDRLPRLLSSVISARKSSMKKEVILFWGTKFKVPEFTVVLSSLRSENLCSFGLHGFVILT